MRSNSREIEASLAIWSETPQVVAEQIAALTSIGSYRLLPQGSQIIHDLYLDTPDGALGYRALALRLREIGGTRWVTLKGGSQPADWGGGVERLEIEALWSRDALIRVVKELTDRGIKILGAWGDFDYAYPLDVIASLGLHVVQDRESHRKLRRVVEGEGQGPMFPVLAELAIDSVVYHFSGQEVRYYEVEIEAKVEDGSTVIKTVVESLAAMYGPALRTWDYGKLATGKAIEELLKAGALEGLLDVNGDLKPVAFDKLDDYLKGAGL